MATALGEHHWSQSQCTLGMTGGRGAGISLGSLVCLSPASSLLFGLTLLLVVPSVHPSVLASCLDLYRYGGGLSAIRVRGDPDELWGISSININDFHIFNRYLQSYQFTSSYILILDRPLPPFRSSSENYLLPFTTQTTQIPHSSTCSSVKPPHVLRSSPSSSPSQHLHCLVQTCLLAPAAVQVARRLLPPSPAC